MAKGMASIRPLPPFSALDCFWLAIKNGDMKIRGRVHNGLVILEGGPALPEGTKVTVSCDHAAVSPPRREKKRLRFPLVRSKHPGSLRLTSERIAEILDEEDASPRR